MRQIIQKIFGINNTQKIYINPECNSIDIIPQDIELLLDYVNDNGPDVIQKHPIVIPDLNRKNELNGVDENQFEIILEDTPLFDDIETSIREDKSKTLKKKYFSAAKILNLQYMSRFQKEFPNFVIQVAKAFYEKNRLENEQTLKLVTLLHYMYHECDIGIKP